MRIKKIIAVCMAAGICMSIALLTGCSNFAASNNDSQTVDINPLGEAAAKDSEEVSLYFGYQDTGMLIGETREIEIPVNEKREEAILKELIKGPSVTSSEFTQLINPETQVVNVSDTGDFLFVTLSREFLMPVDNTGSTGESETKVNPLAVYSIVNTLVEQGQFSRIQILVDTDGTGNGQRVSLSQVGLEGEGTLEPLGRNGEIILTPQNTMEQMLSLMEKKDFQGLYNFIAYSDSYQITKPELDEFVTSCINSNVALKEYQIIDSNVTASAQNVVIMVDYTYDKGDETTEKTNIPVKMVRENDVWKMTNSTFEKMFSIGQ